jgi:hypothetical protein
MSRSAPKSVPTPLLVLLFAALCLVLVAALLPPDVAWATPPQQGEGKGSVPPRNPPGIPEPATITLVGLGIGALTGYAWRRRKTDEQPPTE